jgi:hypothetical protein
MAENGSTAAGASVEMVWPGVRIDASEVVAGEDIGAFRRLVKTWFEEHQPRDATEAYLVRHAARLTWKLDRAERDEAALISNRRESAEAAKSEDSPQATAAGKVSSFPHDNEAERLRRYQFSLHRALMQTLATLVRLKGKSSKESRQSAKTPTSIPAGAISADVGDSRFVANSNSGFASSPSHASVRPGAIASGQGGRIGAAWAGYRLPFPPEAKLSEPKPPEPKSPKPASIASKNDHRRSRHSIRLKGSKGPKRKVRVEIKDRPIDLRETPWYEISCEPRGLGANAPVNRGSPEPFLDESGQSRKRPPTG